MDHKPIEVLLVEDDKDDFLLTQDLLEESFGKEANLRWADNVDTALRAFEAGDLDIALVDYRLGEQDGLDLMAQLIGNGCLTPMILLTGQGNREVELRAAKTGAAYYLDKNQLAGDADASTLLERSIRFAIERAAAFRGMYQSIRARAAKDLRLGLLHESVANLPLRPLVKVAEHTPVRDVVRQMRAEHVGCAFIVDENQQIRGNFTERHLLKLLAEGRSFLHEPIDKYTARFWAQIAGDEPISSLLGKLQIHGVRFICVTDAATGDPLGIASQRSVIKYLADTFPHQVKVQLVNTKLFLDNREGA